MWVHSISDALKSWCTQHNTDRQRTMSTKHPQQTDVRKWNWDVLYIKKTSCLFSILLLLCRFTHFFLVSLSHFKVEKGYVGVWPPTWKKRYSAADGDRDQQHKIDVSGEKVVRFSTLVEACFGTNKPKPLWLYTWVSPPFRAAWFFTANKQTFFIQCPRCFFVVSYFLRGKSFHHVLTAQKTPT